MMKSVGSVLAAVVVAFVLFAVYDGLYVVDEKQQVIITEFGEPVGEPVTTPGLHFKVPFIQTASIFEKRFLEWDGDANQVPTKDKKFIWVDTYARWRIMDPLLFYTRLRDERVALTRLSPILNSATRDAVANHDLVELVRSTNRDVAVTVELGADATEVFQEIQFGREKIQAEMLQNARAPVEALGIELLDLRIKRIGYVEQVRNKVYERMISERQRIAEQYRSEGAGESARIRGEKERELKKITSEAYRTAQEIHGRADATATNVYAKAYNRDPEFYAFLKSMESYESALDPETSLVLTTDSEYLKYLKGTKPK